ncbi:MAG: hotdog fold thioesterase [Actinomycetota bacterium]|nr:hotdog fold thioesterase [Actinomycetota bacterium]
MTTTSGPADQLDLVPFAGHVGVELTEATPERVAGRLGWQAERCTTGGILHGGALMTLADTLGAVCAFLNLPEGALTATVESKTNFLRPIASGAATGVAALVHRGGTTMVIETRVTDDRGRLAVLCLQTQAIIDPAARARARTEAAARRYCDAWTRGDLTALLDCYAPDFTLHYFGRSRFAGDHVGRDAAVAVLSEVSALTNRELLAVEEILASAGEAVIVVRERFERDGRQAEVRRVLRYRVEDDLLAECWLYDEDQALVDGFWE